MRREYLPSDWQCNPYRYRELVNFARQYEFLKKKKTEINLNMRAANKAKKSAELVKIEKKIELIEKTVTEACGEKQYLRDVLFTAVTEDIPIYMINTELSDRTIARYKRQFYILLDKKI